MSLLFNLIHKTGWRLVSRLLKRSITPWIDGHIRNFKDELLSLRFWRDYSARPARHYRYHAIHSAKSRMHAGFKDGATLASLSCFEEIVFVVTRKLIR